MPPTVMLPMQITGMENSAEGRILALYKKLRNQVINPNISEKGNRSIFRRAGILGARMFVNIVHFSHVLPYKDSDYLVTSFQSLALPLKIFF